MDSWLYGEGGYYSTFNPIGKEGGFYTAPTTSALFGGAIANKIISSINSGFIDENSLILEIGSHKGHLLADIIWLIQSINQDIAKNLEYGIVESFSCISKVQISYFKKLFGNSIKINHFKNLKEIKNSRSLFVVANEVFDSFKCEIIKDDRMLFTDNNFNFFFKEQSKNIKILRDKYDISKGEIAIGYSEFAEELSTKMTKGEFLVFDYGNKFARNDFSIRVYDNHNTYPLFSLLLLEENNLNLKKFYKVSDITYDVNFLHLIDAFLDAGFINISYKRQNSALIEFGLIDLLERIKDSNTSRYLQEINRVKTLIDPSIMGDRFKMALFRK